MPKQTPPPFKHFWLPPPQLQLGGNCSLRSEPELPFTVASDTTITIPFELIAIAPGVFSQELHFFLDVNNSLVEKTTSISGDAVVIASDDQQATIQNGR